MERINRVKLFINDNDKSIEVAGRIEEVLKNHNIKVVDNDFDLGIAVGGDGSFLRMIKESNFNTNVFYVGVNAGTLGFAQDISIDEIDDFISILNSEDIIYEKIGVQDVKVISNNGIDEFKSLNEIVVRSNDLKTISFDVYVDDVLLENYIGDGLLISTSFGSTAYNLSFGGSIVYNTFDTLQITSIAPVNNKSYRCLSNSLIIPSNKKIKIIPKKSDDIVITVDGENLFYDDVVELETVIKDTRIKLIRKSDYNFITKVNDKFLK